jgi:hypothetical protein
MARAKKSKRKNGNGGRNPAFLSRITGHFCGQFICSDGTQANVPACDLTDDRMFLTISGEVACLCEMERLEKSQNDFRGYWRRADNNGYIEGRILELPDVGITFIGIWLEFGEAYRLLIYLASENNLTARKRINTSASWSPELDRILSSTRKASQTLHYWDEYYGWPEVSPMKAGQQKRQRSVITMLKSIETEGHRDRSSGDIFRERLAYLLSR